MAGVLAFEGLWVGRLRLGGDDGAADVWVEIAQTWTQMLITSRTGMTRSVSLMASLDSSHQELRYELSVRSNADVEQERALSVLRFEGPDHLAGSFFTDYRAGTLSLRRFQGTRAAFELEYRARREAILENLAEA